MGTISKIIFFPKEYFPFQYQSRVISGLFSNELVKWRRTRVVVLSFTELVKRFDEAFK